ncbi:MAG: hypothetical protein QM723_31085 [Myxococcaceae bacterium]
MRTTVCVVALALCACATKKPILGESPEAQKFAPLSFMVGDWDGQSSGGAGPSTGTFTLGPDLQTHVLTRRGFNITNGTQVHEDLTVIYIQGNDLRADYWDNEGHTVRYQVFPQPQAKQVVFESNPQGDGTQYRVTYRSLDDDHIEMKLDIGHAGSDFQPSVSGQLSRKKK